MLPLDVHENQTDHILNRAVPTKMSTEKEGKAKIFQNNQNLHHIAHRAAQLNCLRKEGKAKTYLTN
jgi:hypothetical protein